MSRWDIHDPDRVHRSELPVPTPNQTKEEESTSPSPGRSTNANQPVENQVERLTPSIETRAQGQSARRNKYELRGKTYSLRAAESNAMADIGRFRAIDVHDLARFVYAGNETRMESDLVNLRHQGLVEARTVHRAHRAARRIVTLTDEGARFVEEISSLPEGQRIYHGIVKPRELHHDADLYKVYQQAARQIQDKGGKKVRVRLDFELKESINRAKEAAGRLPEDMRRRWLAAVAEEHGLRLDGQSIHLPDVQLEYTLPDGRVERENLELLSQNYREQGIRNKAHAGFKIYARAGEADRIRRALRDTGVVREVLAV